MKLIDVEIVYGTFAPNVRYTGNEIMALLMQQPEAYNGVKIIMLVSVYTENHRLCLQMMPYT